MHTEFATNRDPEIYLDISGSYKAKVAATLAHHSHFPQGEENLDWLKELDQADGRAVDITLAQVFKKVRVW